MNRLRVLFNLSVNLLARLYLHFQYDPRRPNIQHQRKTPTLQILHPSPSTRSAIAHLPDLLTYLRPSSWCVQLP